MDTVSELMTPWPQVAPADQPLGVAARTMIRLGFRHLPVVGRDGGLVGVATDATIFARGGLVGAHEELWIPFEPADDALVVGDVVMQPDVVAREDDALLPVLRQLAKSAQDMVVVVDAANHPVGVLTEHDAVRLGAGVVPADRTTRDEGTAPVHTIRRDTPAVRALQRMQAEAVRHLVVVEHDGRLVGVISYGDLIADAVHQDPDRPVDEVVRSLAPVTVRGEVGVRQAAGLMVRHKVGCVPVLDDAGRCRRVITRTDILEALIAALEEEALFPR